MSYYTEHKFLMRDWEKELAKPNPDKDKIEQIRCEIINLKYLMNHDY